MTDAIYGYCPKCGAQGHRRERRPNGNDICVNGCVYPSHESLPEPKAKKMNKNSPSWSCNCLGPQNGEPYCPCMMNKLNIIKSKGSSVDFEPYNFSEEDSEDAFTAESDIEVINTIKLV